MIPQDTNTNLCLIDDEGNTRKGLLKMQHNNGNVSLSFFPEIITDATKGKSQSKRIAQIPDYVFQLSDFTMIEMDGEDRLVVTLSGSRNHCQLYFMRDNDITHFLQYIGNKVRLKNSDCNPRVYLLEPLDTASQPVPLFQSTVLPQTNTHGNSAASRVSLQRISHPGLVFTTSTTVVPMPASEYHDLFDADGRIKDMNTFPGIFYNREIDMAVMGDLWKLLLEQESATLTTEERTQKTTANRELYLQIKQQWQDTTPRQWTNHHDLRDLVGRIESDLDDNQPLFEHFHNASCVQRIAFNILLTLSYWNWDNALYVKGMVTFLSPFLDSFIKDATVDNATYHDGTIVPVNDAEADIFWCFNVFYEHNQLSDLVRPSKQPLQKPLFIAIGYILEASFPELLQLLKQKHAFTLDFLSDDCSKWFTTCFNGADVRRLWVSILSFSSSFQFFQCFIVSLLFSLAPSFVEMNPLNSEEFVRRFHALKKRVDLNLLLLNTQALMQILNKKQ